MIYKFQLDLLKHSLSFRLTELILCSFHSGSFTFSAHSMIQSHPELSAGGTREQDTTHGNRRCSLEPLSLWCYLLADDQKAREGSGNVIHRCVQCTTYGQLSGGILRKPKGPLRFNSLMKVQRLGQEVLWICGVLQKVHSCTHLLWKEVQKFWLA